jgi:hypothetical protein
MEDMGKAMAKGMEEMMSGMMGSMGGGEFNFTVHFPGEVLTVEGPGASKAENTAKWKCSLGDVMMSGASGGVTMKATAKAPFPLVPVLIGAALLVAIIAARSRRRR